MHGVAGQVYSVLSDSATLLNARLVTPPQLTSRVLWCREAELSTPRVHCSDHPGTYFAEMAVVTQCGDVLYV